MRIRWEVLLLAMPAMAAAQDFNGRWDLTAMTEPRPRAWWVELTGVGTPKPAGKFVSAYGGGMNPIDTIAVENGELRIRIQPPRNPNAKGPAPAASLYKARLVGEKLEGTFEVEGQGGAPIRWTGVRAPAIDEKDDGSWKKGQPIALFNGKDLTGWKPLAPGAEMKWSVEGGVLKNAPPTTDIVTEQKFWNFELHMDFRIVARSNSGIGLRGRYEIQILDDYGRPPARMALRRCIAVTRRRSTRASRRESGSRMISAWWGAR